MRHLPYGSNTLMKKGCPQRRSLFAGSLRDRYFFYPFTSRDRAREMVNRGFQHGAKAVVEWWRAGLTGIHRGGSVVVPFAVLAVLVVAMACGGDPSIPSVGGRVIEVHATIPVIAERVAFSDQEGRHRVIRSRASNRQLAVVEVTVVNRTSVVTPLLVDPDAVQLGDRRGERINALDLLASAAVVDSTSPDENKYAPLLWGQVLLERNFQATGWVVFDVPKGLTLGSLWWNEVEDIVVDYVDYFKPR